MGKIQLLKAEIDTDPLARGYSGMTDAQVAADVNAVNRTIDRSQVPAASVLAAIKPGDFLLTFATATVNLVHARYFDYIMATETVDLDHPNIRTALSTIFAGKTDTLQALNALQTRSVSRGVEIGAGIVYPGHVGEARAT